MRACVATAEQYPWSSYLHHGLGQTDELIDRELPYEYLSPYAAVRQRKWSELVHRPLEDATLAQIRRSNERSLPYGDPAWVEELSEKLDLDLTIRPPGRLRKQKN
jgi:hypothetical protein